MYTIQTSIGDLRDPIQDTNYLSVNIYYETFDFTLIQQVPKILPANLFGNIGGMLGLLIGGSIMSIFEIIEFVYLMAFMICQQGCQKTKVQKFDQKMMS